MKEAGSAHDGDDNSDDDYDDNNNNDDDINNGDEHNLYDDDDMTMTTMVVMMATTSPMPYCVYNLYPPPLLTNARLTIHLGIPLQSVVSSCKTSVHLTRVRRHSLAEIFS